MINILNRLFKKKKKKLGLALGSGGARGMAHIGVLTAFDEEGIAFDVVAGSSIGSVVGGMYAAGYSSAAMMRYISEIDIFAAQQIVKTVLSGKTVEDIFAEITGGAEFDDLLLPYAAVATDLYNGGQVVIRSGSVAKAMRASSAVLPMLKPVELDGKTLIDGAYANSVPADVVKEMGADFVVGVNLSKENPTNEIIKNSLDAKYPKNGVVLCDRAAPGRNFSDVLLEPDLKNFSVATVTKSGLNKMFEEGYETAKAKMPEIKAELKKRKFI